MWTGVHARAGRTHVHRRIGKNSDPKKANFESVPKRLSYHDMLHKKPEAPQASNSKIEA